MTRNFIPPAGIVKQTNSLAGIRNNMVMESQTGGSIITGQYFGSGKTLMIPVRRKRTIQTGYIRQAIGTGQPGLPISGKAMDSRTVTHVIKGNTALRYRRTNQNCMISSKKKQTTQRKIDTTGGTNRKIPEQRQKKYLQLVITQ